MKRILFLLSTLLLLSTFASAACTGAHCNTLTWTAPAPITGVTITGYNIYKSSTSGSYTLGTPLATVSATTLTYVDDNRTAGQVLFYVVTSLCSSCTTKESAFSNEVKAVTPPDQTKPGAPANLTVVPQ